MQVLYWKNISTSLGFGSSLYALGLSSTLKKQSPDVNFVLNYGKGMLGGVY